MLMAAVGSAGSWGIYSFWTERYTFHSWDQMHIYDSSFTWLGTNLLIWVLPECDSIEYVYVSSSVQNTLWQSGGTSKKTNDNNNGRCVSLAPPPEDQCSLLSVGGSTLLSARQHWNVICLFTLFLCCDLICMNICGVENSCQDEKQLIQLKKTKR